MGSIPTEKEIIFRSKLPDIYIPDHLPLHSYCFQNIHQHPNKPCIIEASSSKTYSYSEVESASRHVAAGLHNLGIRQGQVIMLLLPNSKEFIFSFLAASFIGVISTTANPYYTPAEIKRQAEASGARIIITESNSVTKVKDLEHKVKIIVIDDPVHENCIKFSELTSNGSELPEVDIKPDDVVALPYSSGTTGLPKGVMLTHRGLITTVAQLVDGENPNLYFRSEDVVLCVLPLFHIYSLNSVLLCGLRAGSSIVLMKKFDVVKMMELVERYGVTVAPFAPPICVGIAKSDEVGRYDLSSVRMVKSGAAPMGKELLDRLKEKLPNAIIEQGYGMTEAGPLAMSLAFAKEPFEVKSGSCGTVVRNAELKVIDPDTGISLSKNQPGEICIRGKQVMKGYLNDVEATENTIDKEGWLHTGDVGYVDSDDEIFIVDRLKEMIKYKGFQVAPAELEAMLIAHSDILDAAVVSIEDELAGELPVAFVVSTNGSEITGDEIKKYIAEQVIFYKKIHKVFFVDSIPKAPSGKILRKELRALLAAGYPNV